VTCIAGIEHAGRVYLMADSAVFQDDTVEIMSEPKLFRSGAFVVGFAGDLSFLHALKRIEWPDKAPRSVRRWLAEVACPQLSDVDGEALVGCGARLYSLSNHGDVFRSAAGYGACGSASQVALVGLATSAAITDPVLRLRTVLDAVCKHTNFARPPFRKLVTT
jgi:hypothetical protein